MTAIIVERPGMTGGEPPASVSSSPSSAPAGPQPKSLWYYLRASLSAALLLLLLALAAAVIVVPALTKSIPLTVLTTDLHARESLVYTAGALKPAVSASMAVPGLVQAVNVGGRTLVDGGVTDPLPFTSFAVQSAAPPAQEPP